jgi:hypothetical protein
MIHTLTKEIILRESQGIAVPPEITETDLIQSYKISHYLSPILMNYFRTKEANNELFWSVTDYTEAIDEVMEDYLRNILPQLIQIKHAPISAKEIRDNIFCASGCEYLAKSNKYSRKITTILGGYLEKIVEKSPRSFSTEANFNKLNITGVDSIIYRNGTLMFTQLKTQKNTLTGAHKNRSIQELKIFPNSIFAAHFDLANWTFNPGNSGIARISGADFWSLLDVDYNIIKNRVYSTIRTIENQLFEN